MGIPNENASFDPDILRPKGGRAAPGRGGRAAPPEGGCATTPEGGVRGAPGGGCAATPEKDTKATHGVTKWLKPKGPLGLQPNLATKAEPVLQRLA